LDSRYLQTQPFNKKAIYLLIGNLKTKQMKKFGVIFMLLLSLVSCSSNDAESSRTPNYYGKWKLVKTTASFTLAIYIMGEPQWQEYYDFKTDGTFVKTKIQNNVTTTASGTFGIVKIQNETHFALTYPVASDIVGSCYGNLSEDLFVKPDGTLASTWQNCDGPGLIYQKTK
jgi:hypothetical protein